MVPPHPHSYLSSLETSFQVSWASFQRFSTHLSKCSLHSLPLCTQGCMSQEHSGTLFRTDNILEVILSRLIILTGASKLAQW